MTESDKDVMRMAIDALIDYQFPASDDAERNGQLAVIALQYAIAQPTALQPLTDQAIDAMWFNEKLTLPQIVNRRVIARSVEAAHAIAHPVESDDLTIAYMSGFADGKKAAQPAHVPETDCGNILQTEQTKETK